MARKPRAVVLLSGGLDSTTILAIAKQSGFEPYAVSFRYGQRHAVELSAAARIAHASGVTKHIIVDVDLRQLGGSALTSDAAIPKHETVDDIGTEIPVTYVPARNTVFLSYSLAWAETLGAGDIEAFERMANLATKAAVEGTQPIKIHTPLIHLTKAQIIQTGLALGVDYSMTTSCYDPAIDGKSCGHCDACLLRRKGFADNGIEDPAV
jgi:7-cyano-7-deazaguanine synthase